MVAATSQAMSFHSFTASFDECCIQNEEFCIKNEEFCIKNEELCIENEELCIKMMSHGDKPGEEFLFLYGFFPEGNPNDTVVLPFYVDGGSPELRAWQAQGKT